MIHLLKLCAINYNFSQYNSLCVMSGVFLNLVLSSLPPDQYGRLSLGAFSPPGSPPDECQTDLNTES